MNVKKNDTVVVLSGKDKGKKGKVLEAMPATGKVVVEGINVATCHVKPKKQGEEGGIVVKNQKVMFEIGGVSEEEAREALRLAQHKLPIKTKIIAREAPETENGGE